MKRTVFALITLICAAALANAQVYVRDDLVRQSIKRRAVEAVIWGLPAVNYDLMLQEMLNKTPGKVNQVLYWSRPLDWHNQTLTPSPDSIYFMVFYNTQDVGPVVVEVPPADDGSINGSFVNVWQMPLVDAGLHGADKGKGGKYLLLPPGYSSAVSEGYIPLQSDTFGGYALLRSNLRSQSDADVAKSVAYGKRIRVYPLSKAASSPPTVFNDAASTVFDSTIRYDESFFTGLNRIVQSEPWLPRDRAMIDQLRSLGIEKGKVFNPNTEARGVLNTAAREAQATLEARYDAGLPPFFAEDGHWTFSAPPELLSAAQAAFNEPNAYPVDARGLAYSYAHVGINDVGSGQFYVIAIKDKNGSALDGATTYQLTVPSNVPVEQYWSVTAYDRQTHALIRDMNRASRSSQITDLQKDEDGAVKIYFGPAAPPGKESNWVPTDPRHDFELMFRFHAPRQELFDKSWQLPDVQRLITTLANGGSH